MPIKNRSCLIIILSTLVVAAHSVAQETPQESREANPVETLVGARKAAVDAEIERRRALRRSPMNEAEGNLTTFDLDFHGGTPVELVQAIEQAMGRPLNAIVPNELADVPLPPLKMQGVTVAELFGALEKANRRVVAVNSPRGMYYADVMSGFRTQGRLSDDAVWYFYRDGPAPQPTVSRFYLLTPYLDKGLTVDDITTAIQTGWKMSGAASTPTLSFHKETSLLIAVGEESQLGTINAVLDALAPNSAKPPEPPPGVPQAK